MSVKTISLQAVVAILSSLAVSSVIAPWPSEAMLVTTDAFVYGVLAAAILLYFNKKLIIESLILLAGSSVSLKTGFSLMETFTGTDNPFFLTVISLGGGAVIWLCTLPLIRKIENKEKFLRFSIAWLITCIFVPNIIWMRPLGFEVEIEFVQFVWQAITMFILIRLFSHVSPQVKTLEQRVED